MTRIFADSNFFIALFNPLDSLYEESVKKSREVRRKRQNLIISRYIFIETVTVLSQRTGRDNAIKAGKELLSDQAELIDISDDIFDMSWNIFQEINKKNMSFVDCSSIAVMQAEGINKFLTFDEEDFSSLRKKYSFSFY